MYKTPSTIKISACGAQKCSNLRFEYGVILNGSQTDEKVAETVRRFEYSVILNGSQTISIVSLYSEKFEYGVISNGSQTADM